MIVDGLIKTLTHANHEDFTKMTGLEDQTELLVSIQKEKDLKKFFQSKSGPENNVSFGYISWLRLDTYKNVIAIFDLTNHRTGHLKPDIER